MVLKGCYAHLMHRQGPWLWIFFLLLVWLKRREGLRPIQCPKYEFSALLWT